MDPSNFYNIGEERDEEGAFQPDYYELDDEIERRRHCLWQVATM